VPGTEINNIVYQSHIFKDKTPIQLMGVFLYGNS